METMHLLLTVDPSAPVAPAAIVPLGTAGYALPLCTNVLVTALIVGRIWYASRSASAHIASGQRTSRHAMNILIESGALYLVTQLIFVVLFALKHPAQAIVAVMAVQIYVSITISRHLTSTQKICAKSCLVFRASHRP